MDADRSFLHASEVGPACDKIGVYTDIGVRVPTIAHATVRITVFALVLEALYSRQIVAEEFLEGPCAEAAS